MLRCCYSNLILVSAVAVDLKTFEDVVAAVVVAVAVLISSCTNDSNRTGIF